MLHCIPELNGLQVKSVQNTAEYYVDVYVVELERLVFAWLKYF